MDSTNKDGNRPIMKTAESRELSEKQSKRRVIAAIAIGAVALVALIIVLNTILIQRAGWTKIEVTNSSKASESCSSEFTFQYYLGKSGAAYMLDYWKISALYTETTGKAYKLFCSDREFDGVKNVGYLNAHPNEEIELDEVLCEALRLADSFGDRSIYLAPVWQDYNSLFFSEYDEDAVLYDPYMDEEQAKFCGETAAFAGDPASVRVEFLGGNRVMLNVSDEYLRFAEENGIKIFVDFCWMKNAFIIDYLADEMQKEGYSSGYIISYDGFTRNLDVGRDYDYSLIHRVGERVYNAGTFSYEAPLSIVYLKDHAVNALDEQHYYIYRSGDRRTPYIDEADGLCRCSISDLVAYSREYGCSELLLNVKPFFIAERFDEAAAASVNGMELIWCDGTGICCTEDGLSVNGLYDDGSVSYGVRYVR